MASAAPVSLAGGFHEAERDELDVFHWMIQQGQLSFAPDRDERYLEMWVYSEFHDLSQELRVACGEGTGERFELLGGWAPLSVRIPGGADDAVLKVNKIFPPPTTGRTIARWPFGCARRYCTRILSGTQLFSASTGTRRSTSPSCAPARRSWRRLPQASGSIFTEFATSSRRVCTASGTTARTKEGDNVDVPFTRETLEAWGDFFQNSINLVNCSIGEPFMMPNFDELLDIFGNSAKVLEMTTNGQILTERNIQKLLGRRIYLYVSLDAATARPMPGCATTSWTTSCTTCGG